MIHLYINKVITYYRSLISSGHHIEQGAQLNHINLTMQRYSDSEEPTIPLEW